MTSEKNDNGFETHRPHTHENEIGQRVAKLQPEWAHRPASCNLATQCAGCITTFILKRQQNVFALTQSRTTNPQLCCTGSIPLHHTVTGHSSYNYDKIPPTFFFEKKTRSLTAHPLTSFSPLLSFPLFRLLKSHISPIQSSCDILVFVQCSRQATMLQYCIRVKSTSHPLISFSLFIIEFAAASLTIDVAAAGRWLQ